MDFDDKKIIDKTAISKLNKEIGSVSYVECSALTLEGIDAVFDAAIRNVFYPPIRKKKCCYCCMLL